jgi:hypothetical protein
VQRVDGGCAAVCWGAGRVVDAVSGYGDVVVLI